MPDYADEAKNGMKITGVRDGGPAAKAGLKGGDAIVRVGGKPIGTIYDYMESMKRYKPGDKVEVVVKRDGKDVSFRSISPAQPAPQATEQSPRSRRIDATILICSSAVSNSHGDFLPSLRGS